MWSKHNAHEESNSGNLSSQESREMQGTTTACLIDYLVIISSKFAEETNSAKNKSYQRGNQLRAAA
jgi:hypothetical protein